MRDTTEKTFELLTISYQAPYGNREAAEAKGWERLGVDGVTGNHYTDRFAWWFKGDKAAAKAEAERQNAESEAECSAFNKSHFWL